MCWMYKVLGELTVIQIIIWSLQKFRERLEVGKQAAQRLDRQRFNLSKLNDLEVTKQYQIDIINRCAALENLNEDEDINRTWENIQENIKTSAKESLGVHEWKQHKPWFMKNV